MSAQQFSNDLREALWDVHGRKCFHCGREITLRDMVIDHLLPETLMEEQTRKTEIIARSGLSPSYDIMGNENLVPSCGKCNTDKGDLILAPGSIGIATARVAKKLPELERQLSAHKKARDLDKILRDIARAVNQDKFSKEELELGLKSIPSKSEGRIKFRDSAPVSGSQSIVFTQHALQNMQDRDVFIADILHAIRNGEVLAGKTSSNPEHFYIQGQDGLRVVYAIKGNQIIILTAFMHRSRQ